MRGGDEIMKKSILSLFVLTTLPVIAAKITAETQITWNPIVIVAAANSVGLESYYRTNQEVSSVYNKIMYDLLNRKTFSAIEATSVCKKYCEKSEFLKNSRGESGKKCPEICEGFGIALVAENNKGTNSLLLDADYNYYHPMGRVYTRDKQFYAENTKTIYVGGKHEPECRSAIFEAKTNKIIAVCAGSFGEDGALDVWYDIKDSRYKDYEFRKTCDYSLMVDDDGICSLIYESPQTEYENLYESSKNCINRLRNVKISDVTNLLSNDLLTDTAKSKLQKWYDARNDIYNAGKFTATSYNLKGELEKFNDKYCSSNNFKLVNQNDIETMKENIQKAENLFRDTKRFKNVQTTDLEEAKGWISNSLDWYIDGNKLKCSGKCNKMPGTQDNVTCTLGHLQATFEFDDICDRNLF
jgi:hypothetical protein